METHYVLSQWKRMANAMRPIKNWQRPFRMLLYVHLCDTSAKPQGYSLHKNHLGVVFTKGRDGCDLVSGTFQGSIQS